MTVRDVREWAINCLNSGENFAFALGAMLATEGRFSQSECGPAGFAEESDFCEGGREALLRLRHASGEATPAGRLRHGQIVSGRTDPFDVGIFGDVDARR